MDRQIKTETEDSPKRDRKPRPPKKITAAYLQNAGLYYLQRFAASESQFRRVMMRKVALSCRYHTDQDREQCAALVEDLIAGFRRSGLLNDAGFATGLARSLRRRGMSARALTQKMQQKGLSADLIQSALGDIDGETSSSCSPDLAAALRLARRRRIGPFARVRDEADRARHMASLARAGFSYDIVEQALAMSAEDAEAALDL